MFPLFWGSFVFLSLTTQHANEQKNTFWAKFIAVDCWRQILYVEKSQGWFKREIFFFICILLYTWWWKKPFSKAINDLGICIRMTCLHNAEQIMINKWLIESIDPNTPYKSILRGQVWPQILRKPALFFVIIYSLSKNSLKETVALNVKRHMG